MNRNINMRCVLVIANKTQSRHELQSEGSYHTTHILYTIFSPL